VVSSTPDKPELRLGAKLGALADRKLIEVGRLARHRCGAEVVALQRIFRDSGTEKGAFLRKAGRNGRVINPPVIAEEKDN
jgi:hypothetical protein